MRESMKTRFLSDGQCSYISMAAVHCDIRLSKADQERVLAEGKARPHRWAPEAGYVTFVVRRHEDLESALNLIRMSHLYFADKASVPQMQNQ